MDEPIDIAIGVAVVVVCALIAYYFYIKTPVPTVTTGTDQPGATVPLNQFQWDPATTSTLKPAEAIIAGSYSGTPLYIAAVSTATGWRFAKSDGVNAWYADGDTEAMTKIAAGVAVMLPYSAVPTAVWATGLTAGGIALSASPNQYFCRAAMANGVHPGVYDGTSCRVTYGGKTLTSPTFEYLLVRA